jgi:hypothetical protein
MKGRRGKFRPSSQQYKAAAQRRYKEAQILMRARPPQRNGAVYLGGYVIECILKAIVCRLPTSEKRRRLLYQSHDLVGLLNESVDAHAAVYQYVNCAKAFARVAALWDVQLRYVPRELEPAQVADFFLRIEEVRKCLEPLA